MGIALIYGVSLIICVGLLCFKGITIKYVHQEMKLDDDTLRKMKEMFETANETDTDKDPTYTEVMNFIDETFGGDDYGNEPTEATEE